MALGPLFPPAHSKNLFWLVFLSSGRAAAAAAKKAPSRGTARGKSVWKDEWSNANICVSAMWIRCPVPSHRCTKIFSYFAGAEKMEWGGRPVPLCDMHECVFYIFQYLSWLLVEIARRRRSQRTILDVHRSRICRNGGFSLLFTPELVSKNGFECPGAFPPHLLSRCNVYQRTEPCFMFVERFVRHNLIIFFILSLLSLAIDRCPPSFAPFVRRAPFDDEKLQFWYCYMLCAFVRVPSERTDSFLPLLEKRISRLCWSMSPAVQMTNRQSCVW
jgi:hypothetical protein